MPLLYLLLFSLSMRTNAPRALSILHADGLDGDRAAADDLDVLEALVDGAQNGVVLGLRTGCLNEDALLIHVLNLEAESLSHLENLRAVFLADVENLDEHNFLASNSSVCVIDYFDDFDHAVELLLDLLVGIVIRVHADCHSIRLPRTLA